MSPVRIGAEICRICAGTHTRNFLPTFAAALLAVSYLLAGQKSHQPSKATSAGSFDKPIKKVTVDLGHSPYFPDDQTMRNKLSCFYFPHLMIKQYDQGQVGSQWLSILRSQGNLPGCKLSHEPQERVIQPSEWGGYFKGLKGNLVFFDAGEMAADGSISFAVYDLTTGKKLFEDDADPSDNDVPSNLQVISTKAGYLLRYRRVDWAGCDLHAEGMACWKKIKAKFGLKSMPVCRSYSAELFKAFQTDTFESVIAYPVEVTLSPHPVTRTVAGPSKCWPRT
jgi:hypothetical protein